MLRTTVNPTSLLSFSASLQKMFMPRTINIPSVGDVPVFNGFNWVASSSRLLSPPQQVTPEIKSEKKTFSFFIKEQ
jgi:hypothetical protein